MTRISVLWITLCLAAVCAAGTKLDDVLPCDEKLLGIKLTENLLGRAHMLYQGNIGLHYAEAATAVGALRFAEKIQDKPLIALLVDNRSNSSADFKDALAVTALGKVNEVQDAEKENLSSVYLAKHPHLSVFISSPNQAFLKVDVSKYILVSNFQRVLEIDVDE